MRCKATLKFSLVYPSTLKFSLSIVINHSNVLMNEVAHLIGLRYKFAMVYPSIYCHKLDVILKHL